VRELLRLAVQVCLDDRPLHIDVALVFLAAPREEWCLRFRVGNAGDALLTIPDAEAFGLALGSAGELLESRKPAAALEMRTTAGNVLECVRMAKHDTSGGSVH
jgi:hypothetical protein